MKIGWPFTMFTEKSMKNMRSWLLTFNVIFGIVSSSFPVHADGEMSYRTFATSGYLDCYKMYKVQPLIKNTI